MGDNRPDKRSIFKDQPWHPNSPQLEARFGLPDGFFEKLAQEDDWSFIIKIHALVETAVSHALCDYFHHDALLDVFSRIELSNAETGKLAFAEATGLLRKESLTWIRKLSEIRNRLVHNVQNVGKSLTEVLATMDKNQRKAHEHAFAWGGLEKYKALYKGDDWRNYPERLICCWSLAAVHIHLGETKEALRYGVTAVFEEMGGRVETTRSDHALALRAREMIGALLQSDDSTGMAN